ncbi:uncharacterized protein LOC123549671 isoform X4 [Mercenaria mercenaria]|uniref:uncharacterized protein LOC123549671 isoform X4 n=1 Tax=Mercenaria mercenaria TaxID=6596 RepID=UPI00234E7C46|nr:uncharacterized protein LOC123549671 isoform X4 [Mercenaria mercenaria]
MPESGSNPDFFFLISYCSFLSCIVCIYSICSSFTLYSCSFINLTNIIFDMIKKNSHLLSINDPGIPHGYKGLFLDNGYMIKHNYVDGFRLKSDLYININLQKKMEVKEYPHVFPTWEIFPRAHYFKNRYVDLHLRFNKVMSALPKRFHRKDLMSQLDILSRCLRSFLQVTVIGMEDMAVGQFIVSTEALEKHTDLPGPVNEGIHICICHAKIRDLGELGKQLKEDLSEAVTSAEKKLAAMNRITIVMRKMVFEVRGYLKQTVVTIEILESGQRKLALEDITDKMREDIMGTKVVYGMRTLYGQLEIHLKMGLDEATLTDAKDNINQIMKTHRFSHPFTIKTVDKAPQILARDFYEQGDIIFSPFPDNGEQIRKGTLGCFIKSTDGVTYGVTCAHVVDPHENNEHKVYIRSPDCLFAISNPNMIVYGRDKDQYLTDFTAIRVVPEKLNMCSFYFKDESGNNKNVKLSRESSSELVGSYVLKYGAATGCTNGIIASNSYIFGGQSSIEHLVIVEPLPVTSDEVCDILTNGSSNSLPSTQGELPIAPAEGAQTDTEEPDVVDLLYITSTDIV